MRSLIIDLAIPYDLFIDTSDTVLIDPINEKRNMKWIAIFSILFY